MRTPIELALSVRSYERIICLTDPAADRDEYPEHWHLPRTMRESRIDQASVVIVDKIQLSPRALGLVAARDPRLIAFAISDVDAYKAVRRLIKGCYPFADIWEFNDIDMAKLLVTNAKGYPYDRDQIVDMRPTERA